MTLEKARELLQTQIDFGSGYNRNAAKLILIEVQKEHGIVAYNQLVIDMALEKHFGFKQNETLSY